MAAVSARRIVSQCRAHVQRTASNLPSWVEHAPKRTPYGVERAAAEAGRHAIALRHRVEHLESTTNALLSHLEGLHVLWKEDTFHPLPMIPIARAIAEIAASAAWMFEPEVTQDERTARGYSALFRSFDASMASSPEVATEVRERLVVELRARGIEVLRRRSKEGVELDEVAQVRVGRVGSKTRVPYSQRIAEQIPSIAGTYSGMSGIAHGETMHLSTIWDTPDTHARLVGTVVHNSVTAWSRAVHSWVGVDAGLFLNQNDLDNLIKSMPPDYLAEFSQAASTVQLSD